MPGREFYLAVLVLLWTLTSSQGVTMADLDRVKQFKAQVAFAEATALVNSQSVVLDWNKLPAVLALGRPWRSLEDTLSQPGPGQAVRIWTFVNGEQRLRVEIFVSSTGAVALERLVEIAARTMTPEVPFVKSTEALGHLAIKHINPKRHHLIWVFNNICAQMISQGSEQINIMPLALQLQNHMNKHLTTDLSQHMPQVEVRTQPKSVRVDETFQVAVILKSAIALHRIKFSVETPGKGISLVDMHDMSLQYRALDAGRAIVTPLLTDNVTLLSPTLQAAVEILPRR